MRPFILALFIACLPVSAVAEDSDIDRGMDLLGRGTELLLQGLLAEIGPELEELKGMLGRIDGYHAPEILPNGDIIIRKRQGHDAFPVPDPDTGEVDL